MHIPFFASGRFQWLLRGLAFDSFQRRARAAAVWVRQHRGKIWGHAIAVVGLLSGILGISGYFSAKADVKRLQAELVAARVNTESIISVLEEHHRQELNDLKDLQVQLSSVVAATEDLKNDLDQGGEGSEDEAYQRYEALSSKKAELELHLFFISDAQEQLGEMRAGLVDFGERLAPESPQSAALRTRLEQLQKYSDILLQHEERISVDFETIEADLSTIRTELVKRDRYHASDVDRD